LQLNGKILLEFDFSSSLLRDFPEYGMRTLEVIAFFFSLTKKGHRCKRTCVFTVSSLAVQAWQKRLASRSNYAIDCIIASTC